MRTIVSFVRDHSASMRNLKSAAMNDYNLMLKSIKDQSSYEHEIYGSVVACGENWRTPVKVLEQTQPIKLLRQVLLYDTDGNSTPLWESVWVAINEIEDFSGQYKSIKSQNQDAYLVIVTTDGRNNAGPISADRLMKRIYDLQGTDRWTFVFRVPVGHKQAIVALGVHPENVIEWEQTTESLVRTSENTQVGINNYFVARSAGLTSSSSFYTDLKNVKPSDLKKTLDVITHEIDIKRVRPCDHQIQIRDFVEQNWDETYQKGCYFYQLTKPEKIQSNKRIIIKHRKSGVAYGGRDARDVLGLPDYDTKVNTGDHGQYDIYVQSTSVNRKLMSETNVIRWDN